MEDENKVRIHPTKEAASLEERLAAARTRTREANAKRDALEEERTLLEQVEAAEHEARDTEAIANAEAEHGAHKISAIKTKRNGSVIVKCPHPIVYKRFRDKGDAKTTDLEKLVRKCLVYPNAGRFDTILEDEPATLDRAANACVELAGFRLKEVSGK